MSVSDISYVPVLLPSRGRFYGGKVPDGRVEIRRMRVGEEVIIQTTSSGLEMVTKILQACCKIPGGVHPRDLTMGDRLGLLMALRVYTFGPKMRVSFQCTSCGAKNGAEIDVITGLKERPVADNINEPVEVTLEDADAIVGLRFLRGSDEAAIARAAKKGGLEVDNSLVTRLCLMMVSVNGEPLDTEQAKLDFVNSLSMPDAQTIREKMSELEPTVDLRSTCTCTTCMEECEVLVTLNAEFFRKA